MRMEGESRRGCCRTLVMRFSTDGACGACSPSLSLSLPLLLCLSLSIHPCLPLHSLSFSRVLSLSVSRPPSPFPSAFPSSLDFFYVSQRWWLLQKRRAGCPATWNISTSMPTTKLTIQRHLGPPHCGTRDRPPARSHTHIRTLVAQAPSHAGTPRAHHIHTISTRTPTPTPDLTELLAVPRSRLQDCLKRRFAIASWRTCMS